MSLGLTGAGVCQTYDLGGSSPQGASQQSTQNQSAGDSQGNNNFSWGAGINVARQARAAQDALARNDYAAAVNYAQQAAKSAPQNSELWFLLGYAARLNERFQLSVDSYDRGLKLQPN